MRFIWGVLLMLAIMLLLFVFILAFVSMSLVQQIIVISKAEKERYCKGRACCAENQGLRPEFTQPKLFAKELVQLYHYHDVIYTQNHTYTPIMYHKFSSNSKLEPANCFVLSLGAITYVIFRGTKTRAEWLLDVRIGQTNLLNLGRVHAGFSQLYLELREALILALQKTPSKKIIVFGHSLGGALTDITAIDLSVNYPEIFDKSFFVASAAPRALSPIALSKLRNAAQLLHIVNVADIVVSIPPSVCNIGIRGTYYYKQYTDNQVLINQVMPTIAGSHVTQTYCKSLLAGNFTHENNFIRP